MFCFSSSFIVINSIVIYLVRSRDHSAQRKTNDEVKYNKKTNKLRKTKAKVIGITHITIIYTNEKVNEFHVMNGVDLNILIFAHLIPSRSVNLP